MHQRSQPATNSFVTLINVFELPRALSSQTRFQLVNVAHWESREPWQADTADAEFQERI
jgi:hypothetical protein